MSGFRLLNLDFSPIKGPEGNIEYLLYLQKAKEASEDGERLRRAEIVVEAAHRALRESHE